MISVPVMKVSASETPTGRYYIQIAPYEADESLASDYTLYSDFMP